MKLRNRLLALSALLLLSGAARAEATLCKEVVPPATISKPGLYCLKKDYSIPVGHMQAAIRIASNNVVLDLNDHRIVNTISSLDKNSTGIVAGQEGGGAGYHTITIRNGVVRGFTDGVRLEGKGSKNSRVERMLIDRSSHSGISVWGDQMIVRGNRVFNTGLGGSYGGVSRGIDASGEAITIDDNHVDFVVATKALAIGVNVFAGNAVVTSNRVSRIAESGQRGCAIATQGSAALRDNNVIAKSASADGFCADDFAVLVDNQSLVGGTKYIGGALATGRNF